MGSRLSFSIMQRSILFSGDNMGHLALIPLVEQRVPKGTLLIRES